MHWTEFIALRERVRLGALNALQALGRGDTGPAASLLQGWRFAEHEQLLEPFLQRLQVLEPQPSAGAWTALMAPVELLKVPAPGPLALHSWLRLLEAQESPVPDDVEQARAWALAALAMDGLTRDELERRAWALRKYPEDEDLDERVRGLWAAWFSMDLTALWPAWDNHFLQPSLRVVGAVMEQRDLPVAVRRRVRKAFVEQFFYLCMGPDGTPPPWRAIAARVVEAADAEGPVQGLGRSLSPESQDRSWRCAQRRAPWSMSLSGLPWPDPGPGAPLVFETEQPMHSALDSTLDLHLALRVLERLGEPPRTPEQSRWSRVVHHLGRARGRLRALARDQEGAELEQRLLALPSLYARTQAALRQHFFVWAYEELHLDWPVSAWSGAPACEDTPLLAPPEAPPRRALRWGEQEQAAMRAWILLVILRGQERELRRWVISGGNTSGGLARALQRDLPDTLLDFDPPRRGYLGVRAWLTQHLGAEERALTSTIAMLADLPFPDSAAARGQFRAALNELLTPHVQVPARGFPAMHDAAETWRRSRDAR